MTNLDAIRDLDEPRARAVIEVMCMAALADGELGLNEHAELVSTITSLAPGAETYVEELLTRVSGAMDDDRAALLADASARLATDELRLVALAGALRVMAADGVVRTSEREMVADLAEALGLSRDVAADLVRDAGA